VVLTVKEKYNDKTDFSLLNEIPQSVPVYRTPLWDFFSIAHNLKSLFYKAEEGRGGSYNRKSPDVKISFLKKTWKAVSGFLSTPDRFAGWLVPGSIKGIELMSWERAGLIYSTAPHPTAHLIALVIKTFRPRPWVADFRDPWFTEAKNCTKLRNAVENWLEKLVIANSDAIIFNTTQMKDMYLKKYGKRILDKSCVIHNGYDPGDFAAVSKARALPAGIFTVNHVGEFYERERRPDNFLVAVSELKKEGKLDKDSVSINFVGGGKYVETREFVDFLASHGLTETVHLIKHVPHNQSIEYLFNADVLLLLQPSSGDFSYQIPAKAFEYIYTGKYILTLAHKGPVSDLIEETRTGIVVNPEDIQEIKKTIYSLYKKFAKGELSLSRNFNAIEKYDRQRLTQSLTKLFDNFYEKN
jgi:glycosyltransferase involved in cell wall biosynthesis